MLRALVVSGMIGASGLAAALASSPGVAKDWRHVAALVATTAVLTRAVLVSAPPPPPRAGPQWEYVLRNIVPLGSSVQPIGTHSSRGMNVYLSPPAGGLSFGFWLKLHGALASQMPVLRMGPETAPAPSVDISESKVHVRLDTRRPGEKTETHDVIFDIHKWYAAMFVGRYAHVVVAIEPQLGRDADTTAVRLYLNGRRLETKGAPGRAVFGNGPLQLLSTEADTGDKYTGHLGDVTYLAASAGAADVEAAFARGPPKSRAARLGE